jgi:hypothetical protein
MRRSQRLFDVFGHEYIYPTANLRTTCRVPGETPGGRPSYQPLDPAAPSVPPGGGIDPWSDPACATLECTAALALFLEGSWAAAAAGQPTIRIPRAPEAPQLERCLDSQATPPGVRITGCVQREPGDGVPASVETSVYLSYGDRQLYAVFICRDDPAKVRANMTTREAILGDDVEAVILDTSHDGRRASSSTTNRCRRTRRSWISTTSGASTPTSSRPAW